MADDPSRAATRYLLAILKDAALSQPDLLSPSQRQLLGVTLAGDAAAIARSWAEFNKKTRPEPL